MASRPLLRMTGLLRGINNLLTARKNATNSHKSSALPVSAAGTLDREAMVGSTIKIQGNGVWQHIATTHKAVIAQDSDLSGMHLACASTG